MRNTSILLFTIEASNQELKEFGSVISVGGYQFKYSKESPVAFFREKGRELLIYGYCVDVLDGTNDALAEKILRNANSLEDIISYEAHLGGKYLLIYKDANGTFAIPDATASIPFCYTTDACPLICASNCEEIAQKLTLRPDEALLEIREKSDISQAMPYDLTVYKYIKQLLPNHYFSFNERRAFRFVNQKERKNEMSSIDAAVQTVPLIENLLKYYKDHFKLYCPITSGRDSRVVLSFMLSLEENVETYTINHKNFSNEEQDIVIPRQIAETVRVANTQIPDLEPSERLIDRFEKAFGKTGYSKRTLMIANTVNNMYNDGAVINGDIIGQVGKCSLHRDISEKFASARYFRCKLHNYSKASIRYINQWICDIGNSCEQVNLFDLFSIENRMGRWAAQENLIYAMVGQNYLNIFNSRAIIYPWTLVSRKDRKLSKIHIELIRIKYPKLLEIPFESIRSTYEAIAKKNGFTYYLASFAKYYIQKIRFLCANKKVV